MASEWGARTRRTPWGQGLRWIMLPGFVGMSLWAASGALGADHAPTLVVGVLSIAGALVVLGLEWAMPYRREWSHSRGDIRTDFLHAVFSNIAAIELARALLMAGVAYAGIVLSKRMGFGLWPGSWPMAAQVALALVIAEFPAYWWHRILHGNPRLWRIHTVHHSAQRLYWLNGTRAHPIEAVALFLVMESPLVFMGAGPEIFAYVTVFFTSLGLLQHSNVDHHCGPLSWFFATAEVHRWHHSQELDEGNRNFAFNLVIWDQVFGSFILPKNREPGIVGIKDLTSYPRSYFGQLLAPFRRRVHEQDRDETATTRRSES